MSGVIYVDLRQGLIRALALFFYDSQSCPIYSLPSLYPFILTMTSYMVVRGLQEQDTYMVQDSSIHVEEEKSIISNNIKETP